MFKFYRSALAAGVVALGLAACGDNVTVQPPPPPSGGGVTAVNVTPANATVGVGQTIQLAASVIADSGVSTALNWTSSNAAIATVSASGLVTGVGLGTTTVIATSVASPSHSSAAQVTVTNAATFSISPTTMQLAPGQSSSATATVALQAGQTATAIVWTSLTPAIATVSSSCTTTAGTSVCPITGVSQGSAVITATTTVAGQTFSQTLSVSVGAGASLSINSVTAGATADEFSGCIGTVGAPVILTDVNCQIDVNLNFSPGIQRIDSITVWFQQGTTIKRLARQFYGATIPSGGIVTLSVNTANFTKTPTTGIATVDLWNGPTTMIAQVWPTVGTGGTAIDCQIGAGNPNPTCSNLGIVLNNADGWAADLTKCSGIIATGVVCPAAVPAIGPGGANASTGGFAVSTQSNPGTTYWGGPSTQGEITAELYAVVYNNNPGFPAGSALNRCASTAGAGADCITNVSWAIGSTTLTCPMTAQSQVPTPTKFLQVFGSGAAATGTTDDCTGHENILAHRDNVVIGASARDAQNNSYMTAGLIPNIVVFASTPDSFRLDYKGPSSVVRPQVNGAENFQWINANWLFKPAGTLVFDGGVGPAPASWSAFATANGGGSTFPTAIVNGSSLAETNQNCTGAGCDGYLARAWATDLLGNFSNSGNTTSFGDDRTAPLIRYSAVASPSSFAASYTGGGVPTVLDSSTYNAFEGIYGANVVTPGQQSLFLAAAAGANDSMRIDAIDSRSGLSRAVENTNVFAQGGATGTTNTVYSTTIGTFGAGLIDGWLPAQALHLTNGRNGGAPPVNPGYYTTTEFVIDRAGNVSGCPVSATIPGVGGTDVVCTAAGANTTGGSNTGVPGTQNANLFARRTLAIDPGQPQVTGVSPNNNYAGNSPQTFTLGSQNDLEVIDGRLRIQYPNLTIGDVGGTTPAAGGLVWSYALSNVFNASGFSAGPASANPAFGFFPAIGTRFDASIINPSLSQLPLDLFTLNVQETCTNAAPPGTGVATGPAGCGGFVGDPISTGLIPLAKPTNVGVQVRDVFGSWIFNQIASATTGVSAEFVSPILSSTVAAPGSFAVTYYDPGLTQSCPAGGAVQAVNTITCVFDGINFRADLFYSTAGTKVYRAVQALSTTLPTFVRAELYGLNALGQWAFISRITVPNPTPVNATCPVGTPPAGVVGCDNGLERYWLYTFSSVPGGFTAYRAIGVDVNGFGLASTVN